MRAALLCSALVLTSCAVVTPAPSTQEHCPIGGAQPHAARIECPYEVLGMFLQSISDFAQKRWDPQRSVHSFATSRRSSGGAGRTSMALDSALR